jgi:uridine phosphorylase
MEWPAHFADPYVISADPELVARIGQEDMLRGVTISANGFYGPQGRELRLPLAKPDLNAKLESFCYDHYRITNYEMESSAVAGLSALMGHKAMTVCMVIANRLVQDAKTDYQASMHELIEKILERI